MKHRTQKLIIVKRVKQFQCIRISVDEWSKLEKAKKDKDAEFIQTFFISNPQFMLHPNGLEILQQRDILVLFGSHVRKEHKVITIMKENFVYQFKPKFNQQLFIGNSKTIYSIGNLRQKPKPVDIYVKRNTEDRDRDDVYFTAKRMLEKLNNTKTDDELSQSTDKLMYFTKREARKRIRRLKRGPEECSMERDATEVVLVTREELIEQEKQRIKP